MPLGKEVGLGPGHIVRWGPSGDPAPTAAPPTFGPCLLWPNGRPSQQLLSSCQFLHVATNFSFMGEVSRPRAPEIAKSTPLLGDRL